MVSIPKQEKIKFFFRWTFFGALAIPFSYIASLWVLLSIHGFFGLGMDDWGTHLSNTLMTIGAGIALGLHVGIFQFIMHRLFLGEYFRSPFYWVVSLMIGYVLTELLIAPLLMELDVVRGQINIWNWDNPFPEAAIFTLSGFIIGLLQWPVLKRYFKVFALYLHRLCTSLPDIM